MADKNILDYSDVRFMIYNINGVIRSQNHTVLRAIQKRGQRIISDFYTLTDALIDCVVNRYQNRSAKNALVIDDAGLQMVNRLHQEGIKDITLCFTRISAEQVTWVKSLITHTFPLLSVKIIHLDDLKEGMKFDLIVANPPYGPVGANITKKIIDTVEFKEYVNLLPAKDYLNADSKDLYKYQTNLINLPTGMFSDTDVKTSIANISKQPNLLSDIDFQVLCFVDDSVLKYFKENICRPDIFSMIDRSGKSPLVWKTDCTVLAGWADTQSGHIIQKKTSPTYRWNVLQDLSNTELIAKYNRPRAQKSNSYELCFYAFTFDSPIKKQHFIKFMYSKEGTAFINKLYAALNTNGRKCHEYLWVFPKVDWTREWTIEEILKDYGYTDEEVQAVMDDLKNNPNYKDMKD